MIAALVNNSHTGRKLKISSIDGLIVDVQHRVRGKLDPRHRPNIDVHVYLDTSRGVRHYVFSPRCEVLLGYAVVPAFSDLSD